MRRAGKVVFILCSLIASPLCAVELVTVINSTNNPVNITGSISVASSTHTFVDNLYAGSTVYIVNPTTVTFSASGVNASTASIIPLRPSQGFGRTYKQGFGDNLTGSTTIYTVTAGKTLYVTSMNISGYNTSTTNAARLRIQDAGITIIPVSGPPAGVGAAAASTVMSLAGEVFLEPKQFTNTMNITVVSGTLTFSFDFTGYEE